MTSCLLLAKSTCGLKTVLCLSLAGLSGTSVLQMRMQLPARAIGVEERLAF